jgi:hypothetical protein
LHLPAIRLSKPSSVLSCAPARLIHRPWTSSIHCRTSKALFVRLCVSMLLYLALSALRCTMQRSHCKSHLRTNRAFYGTLSGANNWCSTQMVGADFLSDDCDRVSKGDLVAIPIRLLNRSTEVWGEDANEFRYAQVSFLIMLYVLTVGVL